MAYFMSIGPNSKNVRGIAAKGYHLFRRGRNVTTVWGSLQIKPKQNILWARIPAKRVYACTSIDLAKTLRAQIQKDKLSHYSRMPRRRRIGFASSSQQAQMTVTFRH